MIYKIVLTGGPCAGKTTGLSKVESSLTAKGYKVLVVSETATDLMMSGISPANFTVSDFQSFLLDLQMTKEQVYMNAAKKIKGQDVIILCDRGIMDAKAFMKEDEFVTLLAEHNLTVTDARDGYDGVFHLITAAKGAEEYYTVANNVVRTETAEQAIEKDAQTLAAWTGHPHLRVIDNSTGIDKKIDRLMCEIYSLLGIPVPIEIERKYLIRKPNIQQLCQKYSIACLDIIQTYLISDDGCERRIRQRGTLGVGKKAGELGNYSYTYTEKTKISDVSRMEVERKISKDEYLELMMEADTSLTQIRKKRYCFVYNNNYIEMDVYPFLKDNAIVEVELTSEVQRVELPPELEIIREVTEEKEFKNHSLAKSGGKNLNLV